MLPEKWSIKRTAATDEIITDWFNLEYGKQYSSRNYDFPYIFYPKPNNGRISYNRPIDGYKEISFSDFKEFVLNKKTVYIPLIFN